MAPTIVIQLTTGGLRGDQRTSGTSSSPSQAGTLLRRHMAGFYSAVDTSRENRGFAVAQASPGYLNLNVAAFYWLSGRKVFVFSGHGGSLLMKCSILKDVEPLQMTARLKAHFGQDFGWLIQVLSASPSATETRFRDPPIASGANGVGFQMLCHVNTFPRMAMADR